MGYEIHVASVGVVHKQYAISAVEEYNRLVWLSKGDTGPEAGQAITLVLGTNVICHYPGKTRQSS